MNKIWRCWIGNKGKALPIPKKKARPAGEPDGRDFFHVPTSNIANNGCIPCQRKVQ